MQRRTTRTQYSKSLGQHRLREAAADRIVASTGLAPPSLVFDLGAGDGQLTAALLGRYEHIVAVELDRAMWSQLKRRFHDDPRVRPVLADMLAVELPRQSPYKVVSNVPYAITAQLLRRLGSLPNPPQEAYLVLERDAAHKWAGIGFESQASIILKNRFHVDVALALRRTDFVPHPATESVVVRLRRRGRAVFVGRESSAFEGFVRRGFGGGPTKLHRDLRGFGSKPDRDRALGAIDPRSQPHELPFDAWAAMFRAAVRGGVRPSPAREPRPRR